MATYQLHRDKPLVSKKQKRTIEKIGKHWFKIVLALFALHNYFQQRCQYFRQFFR